MKFSHIWHIAQPNLQIAPLPPPFGLKISHILVAWRHQFLPATRVEKEPLGAKSATSGNTGNSMHSMIALCCKTLIYGHSSYCGIHPVLWDSPLLCFEVVEDKSPITDVVDTYMKVIWVIYNHGQKLNRLRDIWMCWFGQFWGWIFSHFEALRRTDLLTKPFKELLIFQVVLIWLSIG